MQTFLPYKNFYDSAEALDNKRLNKQIVEGVQILNAILKKRRDEKGGWQNHPCIRMWEDNIESLESYIVICASVWYKRKGLNFVPRTTAVRHEDGTSYLQISWTDIEPLHGSLTQLKKLKHKTFLDSEEFLSILSCTAFIPQHDSVYSSRQRSVWKSEKHTPSLLLSLLNKDKKIKKWSDPYWENNTALYDSHKSNLLRKDPEYYKAFAKFVPDNLPYYWP